MTTNTTDNPTPPSEPAPEPLDDNDRKPAERQACTVPGDILRAALKCSGTDPDRPVLMGVVVWSYGDRGWIVLGTEGHAMVALTNLDAITELDTLTRLTRRTPDYFISAKEILSVRKLVAVTFQHGEEISETEASERHLHHVAGMDGTSERTVNSDAKNFPQTWTLWPQVRPLHPHVPGTYRHDTGVEPVIVPFAFTASYMAFMADISVELCKWQTARNRSEAAWVLRWHPASEGAKPILFTSTQRCNDPLTKANYDAKAWFILMPVRLAGV